MTCQPIHITIPRITSKVSNKFVHKPWEMELKYQQAIKTIIGKDYPQPIVIHEKARASALEAFQSLKKN
jgi:deoxyribodipyrimidine photo-lyase